MKPEYGRSPAIVLLTVTVAMVVFTAVFAWNPPSPRYYPVERVWRMPGETAPGPAMGWYGRTGVALGAAGICSGAAALLLRTRARGIRLNRRAIYAIAVVIAALLVASIAGIVQEQRLWFSKAPTLPARDHEY